jgi:hypothetical protein
MHMSGIGRSSTDLQRDVAVKATAKSNGYSDQLRALLLIDIRSELTRT